MTEVIIKKRGRPPREGSMISCDVATHVKKKQKGILSSAADDHYEGFNINAEDSSIIKARNDKLGEKIVALQQLVSPFGKTDTASVLQEALGYIKFLQDQVQVLCSPYMHGSSSDHGQWQEAERPLRSKGLSLVPTAHTMSIAHSNGADMWAPVMGSSGRSRKTLR